MCKVGKYFYLVSEGEAVQQNEAYSIPDFDGETTVLVYAADEIEALTLAVAYDDGKIELSNITTDYGIFAALEN